MNKYPRRIKLINWSSISVDRTWSYIRVDRIWSHINVDTYPKTYQH
jgi:hypothetical protein